MYIFLGSNVSLFITQEDGLVIEAGTVLSETTKAEIDRQLTLSAFIVSRYSGVSEQEIKQSAYELLTKTSSDRPAIRNWGDTVLIISKPEPNAIVTKIGKPICH